MSTNSGKPARYTQEELYKLLPSIYRQRDEAQGGPLKALLGVIAQQVGVLEDNIEDLYENWFIETCDPWVVPYIGDLVGAKTLNPVSQGLDQREITGSQNHRAYVADTIGYRRRKGTLSVLEQLAHDITGWNANCVEYFQLLGWTQFINHLRPENPVSPDPIRPESFRTPDLRDEDTLELLDSPFDRISHTVDVRRISDRRGRYNIPNIGVFLWRLQAMPVVYAPAFRVQDNCFTFSTLGFDAPLFNQAAQTAEFQLVEENNVPHPIRRREMYDNLPACYASNGQTNSVMLIAGGASLTCDGFVVPSGTAYPVDQVEVCDLTGWKHTPDSGKVAVDPVLGRVKFASDIGSPPDGLHVYYHYGFAGEVGGGFYPRSDASMPTNATAYRVSQFPQPTNCPTPVYSSISAALAQCTQTSGSLLVLQNSAILQIMDSEVYQEAIPQISIPAGLTLEIRASQTPTPQRPVLVLTQSPAPPSPAPLIQSLVISGQPPAEAEQPRGTMIVNGIVLKNTRIDIAPGDLGCLIIRHSTLVPNGDLSVTVDATDTGQNDNLVVSVERGITGGIYLDAPASEAALSICDSIIDKKRAVNWSNVTTPDSPDGTTLMNFLTQTLQRYPPSSLPSTLSDVSWIKGQPLIQNTSNPSEIDVSGTDGSGVDHTISLSMSSDSTEVAVAVDGTAVGTMTVVGASGNLILLSGAAINCYRMSIKNSTVFGEVDTALMDLGSNTIFNDTVKVRRVQSGCVRFSYFPSDSRVPRPYNCQPVKSYPEGATDAEKAALDLQLKPRFTSETYGDSGYAELRQDAPTQIFQGADNGAEMGVFNYELAALRLQNLSAALGEYLRFGLEAGAFLAT